MAVSDNSNKVTLMDLIRFLQASFAVLKKNRTVIVLIALVAAALGFAYAMVKKPRYEAVLTFSVEDKSSGMSSYAAMASQFGLDIPKGDGGGAFKGDNIIEIFKSERIIEKTLSGKIPYGTDSIVLADLYLKDHAILGDIPAGTLLFGDPNMNGRSKDSVLHIISARIRKENLQVDKFDKKLSIIKVVVISKNELFSEKFERALARTVYEFYVDSKVAKLKDGIHILENRIDSVRRALDVELYGSANSQDQNMNAAVARVRIPYLQRQMNIQLLTTLYGELVKNLEMSKLTLQKEEPLIQLIDIPVPPLKVIQPNWIDTTLTSGALSALIVSVLLILWNVLKPYFKAGSQIDAA